MSELLHIAWAVFLVVFFFGGSIFVHELGHYLAARKRGLQIDCFSIGFGPKLWSWKIDGVEWCVSLFPLGGYVALPQLGDLEGIEGEYKSDVKKLPKISYVDTLIVAVMGVIFNMIFAFVLASILWVVGLPTTDATETTVIGTVMEKLTDAQGVERAGPGFAAGLKAGDKILTIDGVAVRNWKDVKQMIVTSTGRDAQRHPELNVTVERDGKIVNAQALPLLAGDEHLRSLGLLPQEELIVGEIYKNSPAERAGLQKGDEIEAVDGKTVRTYYDYSTLLTADGTKPATIKVARVLPKSTEEKTFTITPQNAQVTKDGKTESMLGFNLESKMIIVHTDPFTQIADAAGLTWRTLSTLVHPDSDIKLSHLSGPPGIAWVIYRLSADVRQVLSFIVIINVNLAILNLLPLPVLDGGHILLATINRFRRKPVSAEYLATLQGIFTLLLLSLMVYVIFFADLPRLKRELKENATESKEQSQEITPIFAKAATLGK